MGGAGDSACAATAETIVRLPERIDNARVSQKSRHGPVADKRSGGDVARGVRRPF